MKTFRVKVFDHSKTSDKTWTEALSRINTYLHPAGVQIVWDVEQRPSISPVFAPKVEEGWRVDKPWYSKSFTVYAAVEHYDFCLAYFSIFQWLRKHPRNKLKGQSIDSHFGVSEMVLTGSFKKNDSRPLAPGIKETEFVSRFLHELCHSIFDHKLHQPDTTHDFHYAQKNLLAAFQTWGFNEPAPNLPPTDLTPLLRRKYAELEGLCAAEGIAIRMTEGFRSIARQNELYAQGRTKPGAIVTNAKGGESYHNWGVAFDVVLRVEGYSDSPKWARIGALGRKIGLEWGGDWASFKDLPHFELRFGYTFKDFQDGRVDYKKFA